MWFEIPVTPHTAIGVAYAAAAASPGAKIADELGRLNFVLGIFNANLQELDAFSTAGFGGLPDLYAIAREASRLVHNLVSAAATLRDSTRGTLKHLAGPTITSEHEQRVMDLPDVVDFTLKFRNLVVHQGMPHVGFSFDKKDNSTTLVLSTLELREIGDWNAKAKRYLADHPFHILLAEMTQEYGIAVNTLTTALRADLDDAHSDSLRDYRRLLEYAEPWSMTGADLNNPGSGGAVRPWCCPS